MKILVSNDDGVNAKGIRMLTAGMREISDDVIVVAPDRDRSAASNSLTLKVPLRVADQGDGFFAVEGTPTDSVHLAMTALMTDKPDIVVSGINHGANLGDDTLYSGTVAAAMEGAMLGLPAIAVSLCGPNFQHFDTAAEVAKQIVTHISTQQLPKKCLLNVNVPDIPFDQIQGFEVTRLGARHPAEPTNKETDPYGETIYWIGPPGKEEDAGPGTDFFAIKQDRVSVTPLQMDLSHYKLFDHVASWLGPLVT